MKNKKFKDEIKNLIEPHFEPFLDKSSYDIKRVIAKSLLSPNRFDIAFKLFYLNNLHLNNNIAEDLYKQHLNISTGGTFKEFGNKNKSSYDIFKSDFIKILKSMGEGFDPNKSVIPISKNNEVANGAHRVAAAIHLNKTVDIVKIDNADPIIQDYKFFRNNGASEIFMDLAALEFLKHSKNIFVAVIWPASKRKYDSIINNIPNIIYSKDIEFSSNGAINLTALIYQNEPWLGSASDGYPGAAMKVGECFPSYNGNVKFVFFQSNKTMVNSIKENIRDIVKIGKSSIHITDDDHETLNLSQYILNNNSIHFINNSDQKWLHEITAVLNKLKHEISELDIPLHKFIFDGGFILKMYGLRKSDDVDIICQDEIKKDLGYISNIDIRTSDVLYHATSSSDLLYNPRYYFNFQGFKFISLEQLDFMKSKRDEAKDKKDRDLIKPMIIKRSLFYKFNMRSLLFISINKNKVRIVKILNIIGVYRHLRPLYKALQKKISKSNKNNEK